MGRIHWLPTQFYSWVGNCPPCPLDSRAFAFGKFEIPFCSFQRRIVSSMSRRRCDYPPPRTVCCVCHKNLAHSCCLASFFYRCSTMCSTVTRSTLLQTARLHILSPILDCSVHFLSTSVATDIASTLHVLSVCWAHQGVMPKRLNQSS